jgi:aspartyl-tRNA(Asn)/glutamyl-tRNA(Gln) amidotransferase subunit B
MARQEAASVIHEGGYESVIGLEVHAQMLTETKIFCGCSTAFGSDPNTQTCPVCTGMPGVLPVLNEKALEFAIRTGLALNCTIAPYSRFARKNYFYPDLPKGYQISQYEQPICEHGHIDVAVEGELKRIGITRIHMEDDAGKNIHEGGFSLVDLNRTGVPLMEIVSEPDIRSPLEAALYMKKLRTILRYLGVCDGNMEQGSLRCDANVSIRKAGDTDFGTRAEIKNINSFRFVERALEYEIRRQIKVVGEGGAVVQETRLWNSDTGVTTSMRSKEEAHDYRYFPDPDLVPMVVDREWIEGIRAAMPELPEARTTRFIDELGLSEAVAGQLTTDRALADWFEDVVKQGGEPRAAANWVTGHVMKQLNDNNLTIEEYPIEPVFIADLMDEVAKGTINNNSAKKVLDEAYKRLKEGGDVVPSQVTVAAIIKDKDLAQDTDKGSVDKAVEDVLSGSPGEVERYRAGEKKLLGFFVGQVMKLTKGKADPKAVNEVLRERLKG